jgi:hypothetical protein
LADFDFGIGCAGVVFALRLGVCYPPPAKIRNAKKPPSNPRDLFISVTPQFRKFLEIDVNIRAVCFTRGCKNNQIQ